MTPKTGAIEERIQNDTMVMRANILGHTREYICSLCTSFADNAWAKFADSAIIMGFELSIHPIASYIFISLFTVRNTCLIHVQERCDSLVNAAGKRKE